MGLRIKLKGLPMSATASILIGFLQMFLLSLIWAFMAANTPHMFWLIDMGLTGSALQAALYPIDFVVNVLLCIPAAYLICKLRPKRLSLYTLLAVIPVFLWRNRLFIIEPERLGQFIPWYSYVPGWITELTIIPLAVLIVHRLTMRSTRTPAKPAPVS